VDLRRLRYFLTVAEERRFSAAARRLHIAAPSLSQQIRVLERELHVTLFERTARGAELTPAGLVLAERARVILAEVDRAREDVRSAGADRREQVNLRICTMAERVLDGPAAGRQPGRPGRGGRRQLQPRGRRRRGRPAGAGRRRGRLEPAAGAP
jgi:LysR family transcriptional regulator, benzoate and cis,cis-muconate-responsive activator of ben and cat genes